MKNTNMRSGFTMIELIFVIVIIGILAAVAIPKLSANRDDAAAKVCEQGAGNLLSELSGYYAKNGNWDVIENVSSQLRSVAQVPGNGKNGIAEPDGTVLVNGGSINFVCNGEPVVTFTAQTRTIADVNGINHDQMGLVVTGTATGTTIPAKIVETDFQARDFYRDAASGGYIIGGN